MSGTRSLPILLCLAVLVACGGGGEEASQGRDQARLEAIDRHLGTLEQRLAVIEKELPAGERLRNDLHALEQRVGAVEAKATQALETAKAAPPPTVAAPPAAGATGAPARAPVDPAERRAQLNTLMTEYRRRLSALSTREAAQMSPTERLAARRELSAWFRAHRRAILSGRPLPD